MNRWRRRAVDGRRRALCTNSLRSSAKTSSSVVKVGTKVKNIRLADAGDGHDISCKIEGFGAMNLKSEFVKKA